MGCAGRSGRHTAQQGVGIETYCKALWYSRNLIQRERRLQGWGALGTSSPSYRAFFLSAVGPCRRALGPFCARAWLGAVTAKALFEAGGVRREGEVASGRPLELRSVGATAVGGPSPERRGTVGKLVSEWVGLGV